MCLLCYPTISQVEPYKSLPLTSKVDFFFNLLISLCLEEEEFLPSDGSRSTEAVVGFVSHHPSGSSSGGGRNLCSIFMLRGTMARWMCSPLPVLGSLVISSPASCAKPTCSPGESTAHQDLGGGNNDKGSHPIRNVTKLWTSSVALYEKCP